jgi:hypothetical protein
MSGLARINFSSPGASNARGKCQKHHRWMDYDHQVRLYYCPDCLSEMPCPKKEAKK